MNSPDPKLYLPSVLTTGEFGFLARLHPETVREKIRARIIKAHGRPARIPCRELERFGVNLQDASFLLAAGNRSRDGALPGSPSKIQP